MPQFSSDSQQIGLANVTIQTTIAKLQTESQALHVQLTALQSHWTGIAATGFQEVVRQWRTTSSLLESQLTELSKILSIASQQYSQIEESNLRWFS